MFHSNSHLSEELATGKVEMTGSFVRGAQTMNIMFFKPIARKSFHKRSSNADSIRESMRVDMEEVKNNSSSRNNVSESDNLWIPHEKTGIYYPKGQEKLMNDVSSQACQDHEVNWFSYND